MFKGLKWFLGWKWEQASPELVPHLFEDFDSENFFDEYSQEAARRCSVLVQEYSLEDKKWAFHLKALEKLPKEIRSFYFLQEFAVKPEVWISMTNIWEAMATCLHSLRYTSDAKKQLQTKNRLKDSRHILGNLWELYNTYVLSIFWAIAIFSWNMKNRQQADLLKTWVGWHMWKYSLWEWNTYERGAIDFLDIFFIWEKDWVLFDQFPLEIFEEIFELIIFQYLLLQEIYAFHQTDGSDIQKGSELSYWLEYLIQRIGKLPAPENFLLKIINIVFGVRLNIRQYHVYKSSKIHDLIELWNTESHGKEVKISWIQADRLAKIVFKGKGFIFQSNQETISPLIAYILHKEDLTDDDIEWIASLMDQVDVHQNTESYVLILTILSIYDFSCLESIGKDDIIQLGNKCIEYTEKNTTPQAKYNLSFLSEVDYKVFQTVLSLPEEEIAYISQNPEKLDDYIQIPQILQNLENDLFFLPKEHSQFVPLTQLLEYISPRKNSSDELKKTIKKHYAIDGCYRIILAVRNALWTWEDEKLHRMLKALFPYISDCSIEFQENIISEFAKLGEYYKEKYLIAIRNQSRDENRFHIEKVCWKLEIFAHFAYDQDPDWTDIDLIYELFQLEYANITFQEDQNIWEEEKGIEERILECYGEEFWERLLESFSCEASLEIIVSIGEKLEEYMRQIFVAFLELQELDSDILSKKWYILESVIIFLKRNWVRSLKDTDLFFKYCWQIEDISEVEELYTFFPEPLTRESEYKSFLDVVMKYIKNRDISILENYLNSEESNKEDTLQAEEKIKKTPKKRPNPTGVKYVIIESVPVEAVSKVELNKVRAWKNQQEVVTWFIWLLRGEEEHQALVYITALERFRRYAIKADGRYTPFIGETEMKLFEAKLLRRISQEISAGDISSMLCSFQYIDPELLSPSFLWSIVKVLRNNETDFSAQQLCNILYSFLHMSPENIPDSCMTYLLQKIEKVSFSSPGDTAKALYGLHPHRNSHNWEMQRILEILFKSLQSEAKWIDDLNEDDNEEKDTSIITIKRVYSLYKRPIPNIYQEAYRWLVWSHHFHHKNLSSSIERKVFLLAKKYFPDAIHGAYVDWFECDIFIPSLRMNIEVDGPHHVWLQILKDRKRDEYIVGEDIQIQRLRLAAKSEKEIMTEAEELFKSIVVSLDWKK